MALVKDLSGMRFGKLTAIECVGRTKNGNAKWLCRCDCGGEKVIASWNLVSGNTNSCGCIKKEQNKQMFVTHGDSGSHKTRLYRIWAGIKTRCYNKKHSDSYRKYGAKGVFMCDEWKNSYESFRDWSIASGYQENLSIDRIDPKGPYSPENCRWATDKEQQNNRTNNHILTFNGVSKTLAQWVELTGFTKSTIEHRLERGWSVADALQTPMRKTVGGRFVYVESKIGGDCLPQFSGKLSARVLQAI